MIENREGVYNMYCPKCGSEIQEGALFCTVCGSSVADNTGTGELRGYNTNNMQSIYGQASNMQSQSGSQILNGQAPNMQPQSGSQVLSAQDLYTQKLNNIVANKIGNNKGIDFKSLDVKFSIIGAVFWFFSAFLPFVSVDIFGTSVSKSLIDGGDGWFVIILAIAVVVALYFHKNIVRNVVVVLGVLINLLELDVSDSDELVSAFIQKGAGYYSLIIGSVLLIVGIIIYYVRKKNSN